MACKNVCRLCDRLVISQSVTYSGGTLIINIPAGSYKDGEKYCIVIAQSIPSAGGRLRLSAGAGAAAGQVRRGGL